MLTTTLGSITLVVAVLGVISRLLAQSTASPALAGGGGSGNNDAAGSAGAGGAGQSPGGAGEVAVPGWARPAPLAVAAPAATGS